MRYNHPAKPAPLEPGETMLECGVCGVHVTGAPGEWKHHDEEVRTTPVPREYLAAVRLATEKGALALSWVTNRATDEERARVIAVALVEAGLLRQKPVRPRVAGRR